MDLKDIVKGESAKKVQNTVKETIKVEQLAIIPTVFNVEEEISEEESSEGGDVEDRLHRRGRKRDTLARCGPTWI